MKIKIVPVTILCIVALLIPITYAARVQRTHNIIPDPSFESKGITKHLRDLGVYDADEDGEIDGSIEITREDSYHRRRSVHLYGEGVDYPRVYTTIKKEYFLHEITSVSFWFKHLEGSEPNTPYAIMGFWIVGGEYDGGQLNLY